MFPTLWLSIGISCGRFACRSDTLPVKNYMAPANVTIGFKVEREVIRVECVLISSAEVGTMREFEIMLISESVVGTAVTKTVTFFGTCYAIDGDVERIKIAVSVS